MPATTRGLGDHLIGHADARPLALRLVVVAELLALGLPLALYAFEAARGFLMLGRRRPRIRAGRFISARHEPLVALLSPLLHFRVDRLKVGVSLRTRRTQNLNRPARLFLPRHALEALKHNHKCVLPPAHASVLERAGSRDAIQRA